jgi:serine/threonine protein kinase/Tol biopolymer transport system component
MSGDDPAIQAALDALTDDGPFDWDGAESRTPDEETRRTLRGLRLLSRIASTHQLPDGATGETLIEAPFDWGPLHVLRLVGHGVHGDVYLARDPRLDRPVALKLLRYRDEHREALESAAIEEGRLLARIRHPNVVAVHGAERIGGRVGIWMEFIDGRTLEDELREHGPFDIKEVVRIGVDLCQALHAVHQAGLLHRDLKAQNIMRDREGRIRLTDLGAGRELAGDREAGGAFAGTPLYLAPELFAGAQPTVQSDLYSVAVLLFHLLTAGYPTQARTLETIHASHARDEMERDVRSIRPGVPRRLASALARGLAPAPSGRFETAGAMAAAIDPPDRATVRATLRWSAVGLVAAMTVWMIATNGGRRLVTAISGAWHAPNAARLTTAPSTRQLELPQPMLYGNGLSYDGQYFSFAALDGSVAVFDMSSGQATTSKPPDSQGLASFSIMSPDGAWVAYEWFPTPERSETRIIGRTGLSDHALLRDSGADEARPIEWSRDGAQILLLLADKDGSQRLALADVATGAPHVVHEFRGGAPLGVSLSKDARYIAYDWPAQPPSPRRELHIVAADGSGEHRLLAPRDSSDRFPLWTPDGRYLFFISDRSGTPEGWLVPVQDGRAIDEPILIVRNLGRTNSLGITRDGAYYYRLQTGAFQVYEVDLDPVTMAPAGKPRPVPSRLSGSTIGPSYAPDGLHLAFISVRDDAVMAQATKVIVVRDRQTAVEREIVPAINLDVTPSPAWSPDGRMLLVRGTDQANQWGAFIVDAATGAIRFRVTWPRTEMTEYGWVCWTNDGEAILFEHARRGIVRRPVGEDSETVVVPYPRIPQVQRIMRFGMDSAGRLAFSARVPKGSAIMIIEPDGKARELIRTTMPESSAFQGWSTNDEYIVFTRYRTGPPQPHELWRVPVSGGAPERVGLAIRAATARNPVALGPRGDSLAYTVGSPVFQLWMMEHFLPK